MKTCKTCFNVFMNGSPVYWRCTVTDIYSPVTGSINFMYCPESRLQGQPCGPDGTLWVDRAEREREINYNHDHLESNEVINGCPLPIAGAEAKDESV